MRSNVELYLLEGALAVNGERADTGAWAYVPKGVPHTLEPLDGPARYL